MVGAATHSTSGSTHSTSQSIPQCPGEDIHAHAATQYLDAIQARWAARGLQSVADGGDPSAAKAIVDIDLSSIPELPVGDRDHNRRKEIRIRYSAQNKSNAERRRQLKLDAWTEIYTDLKVSTEISAPAISEVLKRTCNLASSGHVG